jgi:hypothetical protein
MRKMIFLVALSVLFPAITPAQESTTFGVYGGYQYTHFQPSLNTSGWNAGLSANVTNWFGVKVDFGGAYKNGLKFHSYMFGPEFSLRKLHAVRPFAYTLVGAATASGGGTSTTGFSMAVGGGMDLNIGKHFAYRVVQADWLPFRSGPDWIKKNARVSTGIVFRF